MMEANDKVVSEVHCFSKEDCIKESENVLSRFEFSYPTTAVLKETNLTPTMDTDGDLEVVRKNDIGKHEGVIVIEQKRYFSCSSEHKSATTLDLVGEQVWRGALYLADYILYNSTIFKNRNVLELASGVGLTSIVASMVAQNITITDVDKGDIFDLISRNLERNQEIIKANIYIKELDFFDMMTAEESCKENYDVSILLAADVVYHNQLTDAFMSTVLNLMKEKPNKVMFIALEKRYVFTIEDMETVAPCYDYFLERLEWLKLQEPERVKWKIEQLSSDFPQSFTYERTRHLVLWKIDAIVL